MCRILVILSFLLPVVSQAQFGNEWIDYSRQHWRFPIANDGLYRLSYEQLVAAGFPAGTISPEELRIYARGVEQYISVVDGNDGNLDPGDYIEVFLTGNDGWLDAEVYDTPAHQANGDYSLFNDTLICFLTTGVGPGLRTEVYSPTAAADDLEPSPWVSHTTRLNFTQEYLLGKQDINGIALPFYEEGEGWFDTKFALGQTRSHVVTHPFLFNGPSAPDAIFTAVSASASLASGIVNHHLQVGYGNNFNLVVDTIYYGYQLNRFEFSLPINELGNGSTSISHRSVNDLGVATDWHAVGWIEMTYGRTPAYPEETLHHFKVKNFFAGAEGRLDFTSTPSNPRVFVTDNLGFRQELPIEPFGDSYRVVVPFQEEESGAELVVLPSAIAQEIESLEPVTPSGFFSEYSAIPLDSAFVIITHTSLMNSAMSYAFHRESQGMDVLLADVDELYLQYAGGVPKHPLAIRRFCNHLLTAWNSPPSHLFLIGKSIFEMKVSSTQGARNDPEKYARNLVPSWGYPTSDIAFTSGLANTNIEMAIPTGRLAAPDETTVANYLNKVVEFEAQEPAAWMKRILHFGGGGNPFEQNLFVTYLNQYRSIAQDTCFGGDVHSFFKTSTDPVQLNVSDSIALLINEGVSLMTFFGHASSTGFDVNIDAPSNYNNQGRYPLLIGNSCYTGNIHLPTNTSTSEQFVLASNAGVIGFIAKGDLGAPQYLNVWTENFYRQLFNQNYGASIGQNMQHTVQAFQGPNMNLITRNTALTFGLHGDPAIVLNAWPEPDMSVSVEDISFAPNEISAELETFTVKVAVTNLGKATNQGFGIELIRHLPGGQDTSLFVDMAPVYFRDTAFFELPVDRINGIGLNTFDVLIDYPVDALEEMQDLSNNIVTGKELLITSGNLIPVYPFNFSIEPENTHVLKASSGDPFASERSYVMQLDTTDQFNSSLFIEQSITQSGGVVEWPLPIGLEDGRVYYWRAAAEPEEGEEFEWRMHSFQHLEGQRGWGQAHFEQFRNNRYHQVLFDEEERDFDFFTGEVDLTCTVYGNPSSVYEIAATRYQLDLDVMDYGGCGSSAALHVAVMDPVTLAPWESNYNNLYPENDFGNLLDCANGRARPEKYFIFRQNDPSEMEGLVNMLSNEIPDEHYVLIYTWKYVNYDGWDAYGSELYDLFDQMGATQIGNAQDSVPFIFFTRMGDIESSEELYGNSIDDLLELETQLTGSFGQGSIESPIFGPVTQWEALYWNLESESGDSTRVKVFGSNVGQPPVELADLESGMGEWLELGEVVSASQYPSLRLSSALFDNQAQTPAQIKAWQLLSDHAPECALDPNTGFWFPNDTVAQGEPLPIAIAIRNIGAVDMDSLKVNYNFHSNGQSVMTIPYARQDSLRVGETLIDTLYLPTEGLKGDFTLRVEANPPIAQGIYDQLEQYHFNNIAELRFHVTEDHINPILDVTFDGMHILNGDLISPEPHILISLDDENPWLIADQEADTSLFKLFVTWPSGNQLPVYFSHFEQLQFYPASDADNVAKIEYLPRFDQDGTYELLVQASDLSGNLSGDIDYRIEFEVNGKPSITEVLNYPNPFSTRTQFVFTLTGVEPPDEVLIRIMTISGRVVREIHTEELGPLNIGRNRTQFWWDGTDQFGDPLANGIYLYTVRATLNGEPLELNSQASSFFKNGIGKMYLIR